MKISTTKEKQEFKPVTISITFETQNELNDFTRVIGRIEINDNILKFYNELIRIGAEKKE